MDKSNRYKIFSDPIHGFISVPKGLLLNLLDHPILQRLRRIRQLGLAYLVFPGAEHSRFSHALGALGLMNRVLQNLSEQDTTISSREKESTLAAILLHDVGHGPFSHSLESTFIKDFHHEMMTLALMERLNKDFDGALSATIEIFNDTYGKHFLHQLISSQLDIDRIDYLKRDSIMTGVSEGAVGIERILKTMRVFNGNIVIQRKGIYALENYIVARRLMYMQVYLHKTVLSGDFVLRNIFSRVRDMKQAGASVRSVAPALDYFLNEYVTAKNGLNDEVIDAFLLMDDSDVLTSVKYWAQDEDPVLSDLCDRFLNRRLLRTTFLSSMPDSNVQEKIREESRKVLRKLRLPDDDDTLKYYVKFDSSYSEAYKYKKDSIRIINSDNTEMEFSMAADTKNIIALTEPVVKPYCCHLKQVEIPAF